MKATDSEIKEASAAAAVKGKMELRVKVAELCGWKRERSPFSDEMLWVDPQSQAYAGRVKDYCNGLPDYPNDLNACAEFEKDAPIGYWRRLGDITGAGGKSISLQQWKCIGLATGTERCRAYIYEMEASPVLSRNDSSSASSSPKSTTAVTPTKGTNYVQNAARRTKA